MFDFKSLDNATLSLLINAIEQSDNTIVITNFNGKIEFVNKQFTISTGYSKEEAIGQNPRILKSGRQDDAFYKKLWDTITTGKTWTGEFQNKRKDGTIYWEQATISPILDSKGKITHYLAIKLNITKQKEIEFKLADEELRYKHLIEQLPMGFLSIDINNTILLVNEKFSNLTVNFLDTLDINVGYNLFSITHPFIEEIKKHITPFKGNIIFEYSFNNKENIEKTYRTLIYNTLNSKNIPIGINILVDDISEKKQVEKAIIEAKKAAEYHNNLKNRFLSNISHEIRTPLNNILGFSKLLEESVTDKENKEYLDIIISSGNHLLNLISDLIDVSKIEAGKLELNNQPIKLSKIINALKALFQSETTNHKKENLTFQIESPVKNENIIIESDEIRLMQIFSNLLTNAIKYSNKGTITFGYSIENENEILFWIKDQGIGIAPSSQDLIFDRFYRIPSDNAQKYGGTGLGLSIVKELIARMNGEIYLNSKPNEGSTFFVRLRTKILRQVKHSDSIISKNTSSSTTIKPLTILIVEDIKHNTLLLTTILKKYAKKFLLAKDGIEAVNIFKENADTIDIILMDLKLPLLNGIEATKMIRRINKEIPIIAITASVYEQDRLQALEAGCTDFIKKPISKEVLLELIPKLISQAKI